jgi:tripartite-type tricarboxylate transporter receptor subunit TctC
LKTRLNHAFVVAVAAFAAVFFLTGLVIAGYAQAATPTFPAKGKVLTIIVPFSPGGSTDVAARNLAPALEKALGITVEVVDKPGAGSQIGVTYAMAQKPDGYTIYYANLPAPMTMWMNPDRKTVFTSKKDFTLLGIHLSDPGAIAVQYDGPYKTMKDLVDAAKANPGKLRAATTGLLSDDHFAIIDVEKTAGIKFATVHFDSNPERDTALMGGKIDASFGNAGSFYAASVNQKLRIVGLMDTKPWPKAPELPTFESQGYKLYAASVRGLYGPPKMDPKIRTILCDAIKKAVNDPEHMKRMDAAGFPVGYQSCAEHEKTWDRIDKWITPIFKEAYAESKK